MTKLSIIHDARTVPPLEMHRYVIRHLCGQDGWPVAVLYVDGKRTTKPWRVFLEAESQGGGDVSG